MGPPSTHLIPVEHIPNNSLPPDGRNNFSPRHFQDCHTSLPIPNAGISIPHSGIPIPHSVIPIPNPYHQREQNHQPYTNQRSPDKHTLYHQSTDKIRINNYPIESGRFSPFQRRLGESPPLDSGGNLLRYQEDVVQHLPNPTTDLVRLSPYQQRRSDKISDGFWQSPIASPLPIRKHYHTPEQYSHTNNTSPILLQRFFHQQKQLQQQAAAEKEDCKDDGGKKRFASHIKLQLVGDRSSLRAGRHQSPEPPPRLSRGSSTETSVVCNNQSPLALRRNFLEASSAASPSLSRR